MSKRHMLSVQAQAVVRHSLYLCMGFPCKSTHALYCGVTLSMQPCDITLVMPGTDLEHCCGSAILALARFGLSGHCLLM